MFYEEVFSKLDQERVEYVVVGGVALVLLGVVRLTADLDLFVELGETNLKKFVKSMTDLGYQPKAPVAVEDFTKPEKRRQWKEEKGMLVFSFYHPKRPMDLIDVFVDEPIPYGAVKQRKKTVTAKGIHVPVVSAEDLVRLKRISGRPQDLADIEALEELNGE
jgi:predicted nucleotidyltransferase